MPARAPAGPPLLLRQFARLPGSGGVPASVQAPASTGRVTAPVMLPGNLLNPADSDFESALTGNWGNLSHTRLSLGTEQVFSGVQSLKVTTTASGTVQWFQGPGFGIIPAIPGMGYILSLYLFTPNTGRNAQGQLYFKNGATTLGTPGSGSIALVANSWTPITAAVTAPASSSTLQVVITASGMGAEESLWMDLVYVARPLAQILVAWPDQPAVASPRFCDITYLVRADQPLTMTHGRQDNISDVQAGTAAMTLSDDTGWVTPLNPGSPWFPNVKIGRRIQVNVPDEAGAWHTRFDGQIAELDPVVQETGLQADVALSATDVLGFLNRQTALSSWTKQEILLDSPSLHWTLDEPAGATVAVESSGNGGPPLNLRSYGTPAGTYAFAGGTAVTSGQNNGMETQTWASIGTAAAFPAVYFAQHLGGALASQQGNWQLQTAIPAPLTVGPGASWTIEGFLIPDVPNASSYTSVTPFLFGAIGLAGTASQLIFQVTGGASPVLKAIIGLSQIGSSFAWPGSTAGPVHVAVTANGATLTFYVNGVSQGSLVIPGSVTLGTFSFITVGGPPGGLEGWLGQISCVSIYPSVLSAARLLVHSNTGSHGKYSNTSNAGSIISSLASYANIPAAWNNVNASAGLGGTDYFDLQGQNALQAMQQAASADPGGLLYADVQGRLNYAGRETRMGSRGPVLTLTAGSSGHFEPDLGGKSNDQYLKNAAAYGSAGITTGVAAQNAQSIGDYGQYNDGTPSSPTTIPALTYNGQRQSDLNSTGGIVGAFQPDNLAFAAQWAANIRAQPGLKYTSLRCDLLTLGAAFNTGDTVAGFAPSQLFGLDINQVFGIAPSLPPSLPPGQAQREFFVEGMSETIQGGESPVHDLAFYISPASQGRAWIPGDPVYGQLDSTATIGVGFPVPGGSVTIPAGERAGILFPGAPYYPPASYPNPLNVTGFVGALDQAGIWQPLIQQLTPPLCVCAQSVNVQSIPNNTATQITIDTTYADTIAGMGYLAGLSSWYFVLVPGWYRLLGIVRFAANATGKRQAWFGVAQKAAAGGTGPTAGNTNTVAPVSQAAGTAFAAFGIQTQATLYCTLGTAISLQCIQTSGAALNTSPGTSGGSLLAIRFLGDTATED